MNIYIYMAGATNATVAQGTSFWKTSGKKFAIALAPV